MTQKNFLSSTPQDLKDALNEVNRKMQEDEASARALSLNMPYIDLHNFPVDLNVLGMLTKEEAESAFALPFYKDQKDLRIGVLDPHNPLLQEKIREFSVKNKVTLYVISKASFDQTLTFYRKVLRPLARHDDIVRIDTEKDYIALFEELKDAAAQLKINASELMDDMFGAGIAYSASDIHLEPEDHFVKLRFRIDGVLQDVLHIEKTLQHSMVTRIKILAKLKLNIDNIPQDGRLTFYYLGKPVDVRVSILPSAYGEEVVMRLLGSSAISLKVQDLGLRGQALASVERLLEKPQGSIITTGPTGSGKTTTLYAFLNELNQEGVKIITLEDPVEYKMEGIVQTPIDHTVNFDFATGLRAILRQDPDIVMIGEIRDQETAETALQAALTGHLVLSTLHTNDASGAIPRLVNMGVKPFVLAPALSLIIAQRLVRRLCQFCKTPAVPTAQVLARIQKILSSVPTTTPVPSPAHMEFFHAPGCDKCHGIGYKGRLGIYEVLEVTEKIQELIFKSSSMLEYKKVSLEQGMVTMVQDGLLKAIEGLTDIEEVFRVAGE
jgi:type IV pilus assembly protein PilB